MEPLGFIGLIYFTKADPVTVSVSMKTIRDVDKWSAKIISARRKKGLQQPSKVVYAELKWEITA